MKGHITPSEAGPSNLDAEKPKLSRKKQSPSNPSLELKSRTATSKRKKDKSQGAELDNAVTEPPTIRERYILVTTKYMFLTL